MSAKAETRFDYGGPIRLMARKDGYIMARRPGCIPFVIREKEWRELAKSNDPLELAAKVSRTSAHMHRAMRTDTMQRDNDA